MEQKKFRTISLRSKLLDDIADFIKSNPDYVNDQPELNSVAGFVDKATRVFLNGVKQDASS